MNAPQETDSIFLPPAMFFPPLIAFQQVFPQIPFPQKATAGLTQCRQLFQRSQNLRDASVLTSHL